MRVIMSMPEAELAVVQHRVVVAVQVDRLAVHVQGARQELVEV